MHACMHQVNQSLVETLSGNREVGIPGISWVQGNRAYFAKGTRKQNQKIIREQWNM